jgi:hypothetical protein
LDGQARESPDREIYVENVSAHVDTLQLFQLPGATLGAIVSHDLKITL